jgi:hypothetical protein
MASRQHSAYFAFILRAPRPGATLEVSLLLNDLFGSSQLLEGPA